MDKYAPKIKKHFENLMRVGLPLASLGHWPGVVTKYGEWEDLMEKIMADHAKAKDVANNVHLTPGPKFKQFVDNQNKALHLQKELKQPVDQLWNNRAKLQDLIFKATDKVKAAQQMKEFENGNMVMNIMVTKIKDTNSFLAPVNPKPRQLTGPNVGNSALGGAHSPGGASPYANNPNYNNSPYGVQVPVNDPGAW